MTHHNIPLRFQVRGRRVKKFHFSICMSACNFIGGLLRPQFWMPPTFHIASLNCYTPKFSGVPQKLIWCQKVGLPKWGDADFCPRKKAVFMCFFFTKYIFPAKRSTFAYSMSYIFGKLMHQRSIQAIWKQFQCILWGVRVLLANCTQLFLSTVKAVTNIPSGFSWKYFGHIFSHFWSFLKDSEIVGWRKLMEVFSGCRCNLGPTFVAGAGSLVQRGV